MNTQTEGSIEPYLGEPEMELQQLFAIERFPNVAVTLKGTVVATWGTEQFVVRRSEDGGETWGPRYPLARACTAAG